MKKRLKDRRVPLHPTFFHALIFFLPFYSYGQWVTLGSLKKELQDMFYFIFL